MRPAPKPSGRGGSDKKVLCTQLHPHQTPQKRQAWHQQGPNPLLSSPLLSSPLLYSTSRNSQAFPARVHGKPLVLGGQATCFKPGACLACLKKQPDLPCKGSWQEFGIEFWGKQESCQATCFKPGTCLVCLKKQPGLPCKGSWQEFGVEFGGNRKLAHHQA